MSEIVRQISGAFARTGDEAWSNVASIPDDFVGFWGTWYPVILPALTAGLVARYTGRRIARTENSIIPAAYAGVVSYRAISDPDSEASIGKLLLSAGILGLMWGITDTLFLALAGYRTEPRVPPTQNEV